MIHCVCFTVIGSDTMNKVSFFFSLKLNHLHGYSSLLCTCLAVSQLRLDLLSVVELDYVT